MKASFQIHPAPEQLPDTSECHLVLEVSPDYLLAGIIDAADKRFCVLEYFRLEPHDALNSFKTVLFNNQWFSKPFQSVKIVYNFPESLMIPAALHREDNLEDTLNLVCGDANPGEIFSRPISSWDVCNVYRVPVVYTAAIRAHFVHPELFHLHGVLLKKLEAEKDRVADEHIYLVFYERKLVAVCIREGRLLLTQTYAYETADDVNYLLLNISSRFGLNREQVKITVSGLLDDQSAVYSEMRKYFLDVHMDVRPESLGYSEGFNEYPPHFFNSLYWSALCE